MIFEIADVIISGLINGSVYALMAVGLTLIYGVSRAFNFAYGSFYSLGGYIAFLLFGLSFINNYFLVFLLAAPILLLFGFFVEKALVAPLRKRDDWEIKVMMITLGLALLLDNAYQVIFGARMKSLPPFLGGAFEAGDFYLSHQDVGIFFLSIGGMGSIRGGLYAAFIVGMLEAFVGWYFGMTWTLIVLFAVLLTTLAVRPQGLMGKWG